MSRWVRLWVDMPTDPKWRVIAKRAGRPISETLAVFMFMMANAGERNETQCNAEERGVLVNWSDEDVAAALDLETAHVTAIRDAMQGKTLDGNKLTGWEKRQPKREDSSTERVRAFRKRNETQGNAPDSDSENIREELVSTHSTEQEPARVEKGQVEKLINGVGVGSERHADITPEAKRQVCQDLDIADAEPLVRVFDRWTLDKPARRSRDAWFRSMAPKLWQNNPAVHAACQPLNTHPPPEPVAVAKPSSSLAKSKLVAGTRHAN